MNRPRSRPKQKAFLSRSESSTGAAYWSIRSTDPGKMLRGRRVRTAYRVLHNFGRVPTDPQKRSAFLVKVRILLTAYGLVEPIKPIKTRT